MNEHDATETAYKNGYEKAKQDIIENINTRIRELKVSAERIFKANIPPTISEVLQVLEELKEEIERGDIK